MEGWFLFYFTEGFLVYLIFENKIGAREFSVVAKTGQEFILPVFGQVVEKQYSQIPSWRSA